MASRNFLKFSPLCYRCSKQWLILHAHYSRHSQLSSCGLSSHCRAFSSSLANNNGHPTSLLTVPLKGHNYKAAPCGKLMQHSNSICLHNHRIMSSTEIVHNSCLIDSYVDPKYQSCVSNKNFIQQVQTRSRKEIFINNGYLPDLLRKSMLHKTVIPSMIHARGTTLSNLVINVFLVINLHLPNFYGCLGHVRFYRGQTRHRGSDQDFGRVRGGEEMTDEFVDKHGTGENAADHFERSPSVVSESVMSEGPTGNLREMQSSSSSETTEMEDLPTVKKTVDDLTLPELSRIAYNIVPYVKRSATLQNLVRLGVDLSKVQKEEGIAELLIKSDFERDIVPLLKILTLAGVEAEKIGYVFTANPRLFRESAQDLEMRIGYLIHKNFTLPEVATLISTAPVILLMDPWMLDEKLGFLQKTFSLTDDEVRQVVLEYAKLLPVKKEIIADVRFHVKEFIGFTNAELKTLVLKDPRIFTSAKDVLVERFDYLHNTMLISHEQILKYPRILRIRQFIFQNRHLFLMARGRAQYDPYLENYVSLEALGTGSDEEFCQRVAKCDVQEFYDFCKTL